jgi:hypothetical protein
VNGMDLLAASFGLKTIAVVRPQKGAANRHVKTKMRVPRPHSRRKELQAATKTLKTNEIVQPQKGRGHRPPENQLERAAPHIKREEVMIIRILIGLLLGAAAGFSLSYLSRGIGTS